MSKKVRIIIGIILLLISPLLTVVIIGMMYIGVNIFIGYSLNHGLHSYLNLIQSLIPYFPYITIFPIIVYSLLWTRKKSNRLKLLNKSL